MQGFKAMVGGMITDGRSVIDNVKKYKLLIFAVIVVTVLLVIIVYAFKKKSERMLTYADLREPPNVGMESAGTLGFWSEPSSSDMGGESQIQDGGRNQFGPYGERMVGRYSSLGNSKRVATSAERCVGDKECMVNYMFDGSFPMDTYSAYGQMDNRIAYPFGTHINDRYLNPYDEESNRVAVGEVVLPGVSSAEAETPLRTSVEGLTTPPASNILFKKHIDQNDTPTLDSTNKYSMKFL